jgi:ribosome-associated protein
MAKKAAKKTAQKAKTIQQVTFDLEGQEYIELNHLLKVLTLANSGGEANMFITNGEVVVNDVVELRKRNKIRAGFVVQFKDVVCVVS